MIITEWEFMQKMYEQEKTPVECRDSVMAPIRKENGLRYPGLKELHRNKVDVP